MRQFVLPESWPGQGNCLIGEGQARYLLRVLRLAPGDSFAGLDGEGRRRECRVLETGKDRLLLSVSDPLPGNEDEVLEDARGSRGRTGRASARPELALDGARRFPVPRIVLVQALAKGPAMDLVVRQAAEAGVTRIIPVEARRSVVKAEEGRGRQDRWERILREGLQQSGSAMATRIDDPTGLAGLGSALGPQGPGQVRLLLHEAPLAQTRLHEYLAGAPEEIVLCVGPEGGFDPDEVGILEAAGFRPLLLPGAILRTETAALFAVASVEIILSERSSWIPSP
jgi:16S rRNA (uracil1498-N3)-methyltransferase